MKQKITIKTISKELGFSTSTVSKALRDSHEISTETKEKIQAYANYFNYKPNSLALQLRNQKNKGYWRDIAQNSTPFLFYCYYGY